MSTIPTPQPTPVSEPYWQALRDGSLQFQRCNQCQHSWLPPREQCPSCLADDWAWTAASGRGRIISWVVYHRAFDPAFADRVPYNVAVVELDEGPRMISNIDAETADLAIEKPVQLRIDEEAGIAVPRFTLASE